MKHLALLAILALVSCTQPGTVTPVTPPAPVNVPQKARPEMLDPLVSTSWQQSALQVVKIQHPIGQLCGSGSPVACVFNGKVWTTYIITARHVIQHYKEGWEVFFAGEQRFGEECDVVAIHAIEDVAIVKVVSKTPTMVIPLCMVEIPLTSPITVVGYPNCIRRVITRGFVGEIGAGSASVFPGTSGGPVLDSEGHLVGVVRAVGLGPKNLVGERIMVTHDMLFSPLTGYIEWVIECLSETP